MQIRPFQGLRPSTNYVQKVASVPYDVVNRDEAARLASGNPMSFLHVVRAEIDLPSDVDPYCDRVYAKAVENFRFLQDKSYLVRESGKVLYLYAVSRGDHTQYGIAGLCHVSDYDANKIKKHEKTRPAKENDRTRITSELSANAGPVFLTYRDNSTVNEQVEAIVKTQPLFDFTAEDGVNHKVWKIEETDVLVEAFEAVDSFYVADGHHRAASAARVARERQQGNPEHTGSEDYNWFLCVFFPASQLRILAYNRIITDLNNLDSGTCIQKINGITRLEKTNDKRPGKPGEVCLYLDKSWYRFELPPSAKDDPVSKLDVSRLQEHILEPVFAITDARTDSRIDFIGGIRGANELMKKVDSGDAAAAFSMFPVNIESLLEISDANQIMAPKSTWFEPKLRSGIFIHTF